MKQFARVPVVSLLALVSGCGEVKSAVPDEAQEAKPAPIALKLSGRASKGPIAGGTVTVFALDAVGKRGAELGRASTDAKGEFVVSLKLTPNALVEFAIKGGSFRDEATGVDVALGEQEMRMRVPAAASLKEVGITPLTEMAASLSEKLAVDDKRALKDAILAANKAAAQSAGVSDVTIKPLRPEDVAASPSSEQAKYALVLAGISQYAASNCAAGSACASPLDVVRIFAEDFRDGAFDGKKGTAAIAVPGPGWGGLSQAMAEIQQKPDAGFAGVAVPTIVERPTIPPPPSTVKPGTGPIALPGPGGETPMQFFRCDIPGAGGAPGMCKELSAPLTGAQDPVAPLVAQCDQMQGIFSGGKCSAGGMSSGGETQPPTLPAPASFDVALQNANSITFSWSAVEGATGYEICVVGGSECEAIYNDIPGTQFTREVYYVERGKTRTYKVRARNSFTVYGHFSAARTQRNVPVEIHDATISRSNGNLSLNWNAREGATGYDVMSASIQNGTYTKIGETSATTYPLNALSAGSSLFLKVLAKNGSGQATGSSVAVVTPPATGPTLTFPVDNHVRNMNIAYPSGTWTNDSSQMTQVYIGESASGPWYFFKEGLRSGLNSVDLLPMRQGEQAYFKVDVLLGGAAGNAIISTVSSQVTAHGITSSTSQTATNVTQAPGAPSAQSVQRTSAELRWTPPTQASANCLVQRLYVKEKTDGTVFMPIQNLNHSFNATMVYGLKPATTYEFKLAAACAWNTTEVMGPVGEVTTMP